MKLVKPTIEQLRKKIEETDAVIIQTLAKRQALSKQIGQLKSNHGTEIIDPPREKQLFEFYENLSERYRLDQAFIKKLFSLIIDYSKKVQGL